jgi:hypothetical protein
MPGLPLRRFFALFLLCFCVASITRSATAQATHDNSIPIPDPTLGITQGSLPLLPGWHGTAHIDRTSDPLSYAIGTLSADLRSPDGSTTILLLAVPFHTYNVRPGSAAFLPGDPVHQRNAAIAPYHSTTELLTRYILPALHLQGKTEYGEPLPEDVKARLRAQTAGGVPGYIIDAAFVTVHNGGREILVRAVTQGGGAGTERETTSSTITVVSAPQGKARATLDAQDMLKATQPSAAWQQANERYLAAWRQELDAEYSRLNAQIRASSNAILAQGQSNIRSMQDRGAQRDREFAQHEQLTSDLNANFRGYLSGSSTTFKWCNGSAATFTVDDARAPGPGFQRCD